MKSAHTEIAKSISQNTNTTSSESVDHSLSEFNILDSTQETRDSFATNNGSSPYRIEGSVELETSRSLSNAILNIETSFTFSASPIDINTSASIINISMNSINMSDIDPNPATLNSTNSLFSYQLPLEEIIPLSLDFSGEE